MFTSPGSIALKIFSLEIRWYGIVIAFAIFCGLMLVLYLRKKYYEEISEDSIFDISLLIIIAGIIFARLYYVILDWRYFSNHLYNIPCIWQGGIAIHGAIIGAAIAFFIYSKIKKLNFLKYADLLSFGGILGQIIGRWGNFFNSEAFGLPCDLPWKLYIPYDIRPALYQNYQYFHPTFLYESLANTLLLLLMFIILKKCPDRKPGMIFFTYLGFYAVIRHSIESLRIDSVLTFSDGLHAAHFASLIFMFISLIGLSYIYAKKA